MYQSNVNLNLYKTFYEVANYGSISETAKRTYTSQPAISKSIKKLEEQLNTKLFFRSINGIELTEKGKELLYFVESAYNSLSAAERLMIEKENLQSGKISIGVPSQVGTFYLFEKIEKFHNLYPNIEITIISKSTHQLLKLLQNHEIDFIIDTSPINTDSKDIIIKPLLEVQNCFVCRNDSKFDTSNISSIHDLKNIPLVLPVKGTDNRKKLDTLFFNNHIEITNIINIHTSEMILGAIKKDLGLGYIIYDLVKDDIERGFLKMIPVEEKLPTIEINLVYIEKYLVTAPYLFIKKYIDTTINRV